MSSQAQEPKLYALLIGINCYFKNELYNNLQGAVNDINSIENFLKERLHITDERIWKLTSSNPNPHLRQPQESPEKLPTYKNIVENFNQVTDTAQIGDLILVYYSGHGGRSITQYTEIKGDRGIDESIAPVDIGKVDESGKPIGQYLLDVEITTLLKRMVDKGLVVTMVFDSCHSGGATRGTAQIRGGRNINNTPRPVESLVASRQELIDNWSIMTNGGTKGLSSSFIPNSNDYVLLAACRPTEKALEDILEPATKKRQGVLTYWLLESFEQGFADLTYRDLHDRVSAKVSSQHFMQNPVLVGQGERQVFASNLVKV
ncbi:MAG: caspase family protein, partial [Okeania sp. SIO1H6]|nr:caspase family protein [Okeania sp. SIO1H6]